MTTVTFPVCIVQHTGRRHEITYNNNIQTLIIQDNASIKMSTMSITNNNNNENPSYHRFESIP